MTDSNVIEVNFSEAIGAAHTLEAVKADFDRITSLLAGVEEQLAGAWEGEGSRRMKEKLQTVQARAKELRRTAGSLADVITQTAANYKRAEEEALAVLHTQSSV